VKKRIAVLISGSGTGLQALIDACADGRINGEIVFVLSTTAKAYGLQRAAGAGILCKTVSKADYATMGRCNQARHAAIRAAKPDLIICAGFLGIIPAWTVNAFKNKIINIHPALVPSFCGKGYYGRFVHEAVLKKGVKLTGATVHFVDKGIDSGAVIMQRAVGVLPEDTYQTLAARVTAIEHPMLIKAAALFCLDLLRVEDNRVQILSDVECGG